MKIHYKLEDLRGIKNPVVTTGTFDGVHIGHKVILSRLNKLARDIDGESVLITFNPHPRRVLYPDTAGKDLLMINTQREKIWLLEKTGIDHLLIINFTTEFSRISSHDFIVKFLVNILKVKVIVIGFNHHFGHNREGDFEYLYKLGSTYGFEVEEIPEQDIQNESVSSTRIRAALHQGNIQRANAYLDHFYIIKSKLKEIKNPDNQAGIKFYGLSPEEDIKLIPPDGVYAVSIEGQDFSKKAMLLINGWDLEKKKLSDKLFIGIHIPDYNKDLNNKDITVYFHKCIRTIKNIELPEMTEKSFQKDLNEIEELIY